MNLWILVIILTAIIGYIVFYILDVPTPAILGPLVFILLLSKSSFGVRQINNNISSLIQIILGVHIGIIFKKQVFGELKKLFLSSSIMIIWTLIMTFGLGMVLVKCFGIDYATAFLSTAPAGVSETGMIAVSVGANVGVVSVFQLSRLVFTLMFLPIVVNLNKGIKTNESIKKSINTYLCKVLERLEKMIKVPKVTHELKLSKKGVISNLTTLTIGLIGGIIGIFLNLPAGAMLGSFILVALFTLLDFGLSRPPAFIRIIMQIGIGVTIGFNIASEAAYPLRDLILSIMVFSLIMICTCYINARVLVYLNKWSLFASLLAAAPAGLTPISLIAYDQTDKALEISLLHFARLLAVKVVILPFIAFLQVYM